jgi:peptidoglycan hydrolase CwlO-like protein
MKSRRKFLTMFLASGVPLGFASYSIRAQESQTKPPSPPKLPQKDDDTEEPKFDSKAVLEANQKDIKKNIERLFQLASELKAEVEKTDSVQVLSVSMIKKAEEIEKLAKGIRSRAIG